MSEKLGWDHRYRPLARGEIIEAGDECRRDDGAWLTGICVGEPAPDPAYTSHRVYRRLKATPANGEQVERVAEAVLSLFEHGDVLQDLTEWSENGGGWKFARSAAYKIARAVAATLPTPTQDTRDRVKVLEEAEDVEEALQYLEGFPSDPREVEGRITALGGSRLDAALRTFRTALGNKETDRHG